jgi:hypothetical protein
MMKPSPCRNQMTQTPLDHYLSIYGGLNPETASLRCGLPFDKTRSSFSLRLMGTEYAADFPDFRAYNSFGDSISDPFEKLLLLRYLCEGMYMPRTDHMVAYRELPWGEVYDANFQGRVINRFIRAFGRNTASFGRVMERTAGLKSEAMSNCDVGYKFEFMSGLFMSILVWEGDEEFSPSAQFLFDKNFAAAFSAEDVAVIGEITIKRLKQLSEAMG